MKGKLFKNAKNITAVSLAIIVAIPIFSGCGTSEVSTDKDKLSSKVISVEYTDRDKENTCTADDSIVLEESKVSSTSDNVSYEDNVVKISKEGTYKVSGKLANGQIKIDVGENDKVQLLLDNATINCDFGPAIYAEKGDKVFITTSKGTTSTITDGKEYTLTDDQPYGAIFGTCGITLNGEGTLKVTGNYNNGIVSKDDLKITGGTIQVEALNNGIKGTDSVAIKDGDISIVSEGDGIKSSKEDNEKKGYVAIEGGNIQIESGTDGIQGENIVQVTGGNLNIKTAGGYEYAEKAEEVIGKGMRDKIPEQVNDETENSDDISAKGLKAGKYLLCTGGTLNINALDDALHCNGSALVQNSKMNVQSGDDGIHADALAYINSGEIKITNSYEGIEGAQIIVDDGTIDVTASDDGFNAAGGNDSSGKGGPMADVPRGGGQKPQDDQQGQQPQGDQQGQQPQGDQQAQQPQGDMETNKDDFASSDDVDYKLEINGGKINVNSSGDGLDSNKDIVITGGEIYVNGPTNNGNGAIDCGEESNGKATISGGTIVAVGSSGMAVTFDSSSTQPSLMYNASGSKGDVISLKSSSGEEIIKYTATKEFGNVVISSPSMKQGEKYTLSVGSQAYEVELTEMSTTYGQQNKAGGGQGGPGGQRGNQGNQGAPGGEQR